MADPVDEALAALRNLGTPAELRALADEGFGPREPLPSNAHVHLPPNFSAFETVRQAVDLAAQQEIAVLGVSNYYDYQVYGQFAERARSSGVFPLFGLEIISMQDELREAGVKVNDPGNPGKTYICGKGITRFGKMTDEARCLLDVIRRNDGERMREMIARLRSFFADRGLSLDVDEATVVDLVVRRHGCPRETVYLQERHVAQAFQEALFAAVPSQERFDRFNELFGECKGRLPDIADLIQGEIRSSLMKAGRPAFVDESYLTFGDATRLILEFGGIPCYPTLGDGTSPLCAFENTPDELISALRSRNVHAAEWILPRNCWGVAQDYIPKMRSAGFVITAGTEHNTRNMIPLEPTCSNGPVPKDLQALAWEGACVVAAHQFLTLHGECGYVDGAGIPNPGYATADERIRELARLGAAVIGRYREVCSPTVK